MAKERTSSFPPNSGPLKVDLHGLGLFAFSCRIVPPVPPFLPTPAGSRATAPEMKHVRLELGKCRWR